MPENVLITRERFSTSSFFFGYLLEGNKLFPALESMLKEIRNYVKRFLSGERDAEFILTMGKLFLGVKYFLNFFPSLHDDFELRVNLNCLPATFTAGFSCVSYGDAFVNFASRSQRCIIPYRSRCRLKGAWLACSQLI